MDKMKNYHDAELTGIDYSRDRRRLMLTFQLVDSGVALIRCDGITNFRLGEMGLQNVLSRLLISSERAFQASEIRNHINWANSRDGMEHVMTDARAAYFDAAIRTGKLTLLVLEPSVGAELVAVCELVKHVK